MVAVEAKWDKTAKAFQYCKPVRVGRYELLAILTDLCPLGALAGDAELECLLARVSLRSPPRPTADGPKVRPRLGAGEYIRRG